MNDHFPLQPIRDDVQHEVAVTIIGELMNRELGVGLSDYLDALILLVNKYEDENHSPIDLDLSPREALKAIMSANGLSQVEMGKIIGSESVVSMFLKGERSLSKAQITALVARFRVDVSVFL